MERPGKNCRMAYAPAKAAAECPDGNDQVPGFLPMTMARTTSMNGRRRLKKNLMGYSTASTAVVRGTARLRNCFKFGRRSAAMSEASSTYQAQPRLNPNVKK